MCMGRQVRNTNIILGWLAIINLAAFATYGIDKYKSMHNKWRTPERTLLLLAAIGGSIGAWAGMEIFRHKTKHLKFKYGVPAILLLQLVAAGWILSGGYVL